MPALTPCCRRFALFLEGLASAVVRPDEGAQSHFVACVNEPLRSCGVALRETDSEGGYPFVAEVNGVVVLENGESGLQQRSPQQIGGEQIVAAVAEEYLGRWRSHGRKGS